MVMADSQLKAWLKFIKTNEVAITVAVGFLVVVVLGLMLVGKNWWRLTRQPSISQQAVSTVLETSTSSPLAQPGIFTEILKPAVPASQPTTYIVKKGDSTWKVAELFFDYGPAYVAIEQANKLQHNQYLEVGQQLTIPVLEIKTEAVTDADYVVKSGDCLWTIAEQQLGSGYKWVDIYRPNRQVIGRNPNLIYPGTRLRLTAITK